MASQWAGSIALVAVAICTGCGATRGTTDAPSGQVERQMAARDDVSIYSPAPAKLRSLATRFVRAVAEYDARSDALGDFLNRVDKLATVAERRRLSHSPRRHLHWHVLRQRDERTHLTLTGMSERADTGNDRLVVVECVVTTATSFARVRHFEEFWLSPVSTRTGLRINRATGPGL